MDKESTVIKHLVVVSSLDTFRGLGELESLTISKDRLQSLMDKEEVLVCEFNNTSDENLDQLQDLFDHYRNAVPNGVLIYSMVTDDNRLIISPLRVYTPDIQFKFKP